MLFLFVTAPTPYSTTVFTLDEGCVASLYLITIFESFFEPFRNSLRTRGVIYIISISSAIVSMVWLFGESMETWGR